MNTTPHGERLQIALFGRRNAGKSSLINAITGQEVAIVSDIKGTTTDPVSKAMELLPLGPVLLIDTAGLDDDGELGNERMRRTKTVLNKTDIALIVVDGTQSESDFYWEEKLIRLMEAKKIPYLLVYNKCDLCNDNESGLTRKADLCVSAKTGYHISELRERIAAKILSLIHI